MGQKSSRPAAHRLLAVGDKGQRSRRSFIGIQSGNVHGHPARAERQPLPNVFSSARVHHFVTSVFAVGMETETSSRIPMTDADEIDAARKRKSRL
jgi:hypothetical protein